MSTEPIKSEALSNPSEDFQHRDRWSQIRESREKRGKEAAAALDDAATKALLDKQTQKRAHLQDKRLIHTPKYQAWTKPRRAKAMPGMQIAIRLNLSCLGNTKNIQRAWAPLEAGPWIVVRHSEQRLLCRHPQGNEIWVNKECGHTTKYLWDPVD